VATESPPSDGGPSPIARRQSTHGTGYPLSSDVAHSEVSLKRATACRQEPCSKFSPDGLQDRM
jgi:hypothetical protein